jgi:hypothetical protein
MKVVITFKEEGVEAKREFEVYNMNIYADHEGIYCAVVSGGVLTLNSERNFYTYNDNVLSEQHSYLTAQIQDFTCLPKQELIF